jgi:pyruvate/2-oxoglutarate dehydrogenase complex dihydrolipoamide acyltransferase (E2) component
MSVELILPKWGLTMEDGTVVAWHVAEGETVSEGQVVADIETEKVENELESPCDGVVAKILVEEDDTVDVGTVLMIVAADAAEAATIGNR